MLGLRLDHDAADLVGCKRSAELVGGGLVGQRAGAQTVVDPLHAQVGLCDGRSHGGEEVFVATADPLPLRLGGLFGGHRDQLDLEGSGRHGRPFPIHIYGND